jgi:hypothetical protein
VTGVERRDLVNTRSITILINVFDASIVNNVVFPGFLGGFWAAAHEPPVTAKAVLFCMTKRHVVP